MKKALVFFNIISLNLFGQSQYWKSRYIDYSSELIYKVAVDPLPTSTNNQLNELNFMDAMQILSNREAIHVLRADNGSVYSIENSFEDFSYGLNILLTMYEATGEISYIENALIFAENLINSSHVLTSGEFNSQNNGFNPNNSYKGWYRYGNSTESTEEIKPFRYILKLSKIIISNSNLLYLHQRAKTIVSFIELNIWHKWSNYGSCNFELYRANNHISCNWAFIALELYQLKSVYNVGLEGYNNTMANVILNQYYHFFNDWYNNNLINYGDLGLSDNLSKFKMILFSFEPTGQFCSFKYRSSSQNISQSIVDCLEFSNDVSHANFIVSYLIESYETTPNQPFTINNTLQPLINTFINVLWKGCSGNATQPARIPEFVDGSYLSNSLDDCNQNINALNGYDISEGWMKLGKYSCKMQNALEEYMNCTLPRSLSDPSLTTLHKIPSAYSILGSYAQMANNSKALQNLSTPKVFVNGVLNSDLITSNDVEVSTLQTTTIANNNQVTIKARNYIRFNQGFSALSSNGSYLHAFVEPKPCNLLLQRNSLVNDSELDTTSVFVTDADVQINRNTPNNFNNESLLNLTNSIETNDVMFKNELKSKLTIYPNPNNGEFILELSNAPKGNYTLQITDAMGRSVIQQNYVAKEQNLKQNINLQAQGKGIYFVKINSEQINEVRKIVVE